MKKQVKKPSLNRSGQIPGLEGCYHMYGWDEGLSHFTPGDLRKVSRWFRSAASYLQHRARENAKRERK